MTLSSFIKKFREEKGYTQWDLANLLGVHAQYISNVERGRHPCPVMFVCRVMPHLDTTNRYKLEDLLRQEVDEKIATAIAKRPFFKKKTRTKKSKKVSAV